MQKPSDPLLNEAVPDKLQANWPWKFSTQVAWLENLFKARHGCRPWLLYFSSHSNMVSGELMLVNFPLFQGRVIREMCIGTCSLSLSFFFLLLIFTMPWPWPKYLWSIFWLIFCYETRKKESGYIKDHAKGSPIFLKIFAFIPKENLLTNKVSKTS